MQTIILEELVFLLELFLQLLLIGGFVYMLDVAMKHTAKHFGKSNRWYRKLTKG